MVAILSALTGHRGCAERGRPGAGRAGQPRGANRVVPAALSRRHRWPSGTHCWRSNLLTPMRRLGVSTCPRVRTLVIHPKRRSQESFAGPWLRLPSLRVWSGFSGDSRPGIGGTARGRPRRVSRSPSGSRGPARRRLLEAAVVWAGRVVIGSLRAHLTVALRRSDLSLLSLGCRPGPCRGACRDGISGDRSLPCAVGCWLWRSGASCCGRTASRQFGVLSAGDVDAVGRGDGRGARRTA